MTPVSHRDESPRRNLVVRIGAALVLIPLTLMLAYAGGWLWVLLATLVAIGLFAEWISIVGTSRILGSILGAVWLAIAGANAALGEFNWTLVAIAFGALGAGLLATSQRGWVAGGAIYGGAGMIAAVLLRRDPGEGFAAILFVLLLVWATDSGGYFAGRAIGGPKLWPQVSPKKTWAGAVGGFGGALLVAAVFAAVQGARLAPLLAIAAVLSVASQGGDLFEVRDQAPLRCQGFRPPYSGPRRAARQARWLRRCGAPRCADRHRARRQRWRRARTYGVVNS